MNEKSKNTWLSSEGENQINFYTSSYDFVIVERKRTVKLLMDLFEYHFNGREELNILDVGCGDGILTEEISKRFPRNNYYLIDGSNIMISKAKERLVGDNYNYINKSFEEYIDSIDEQKYDFVFSSNAIHHMDYSGKLQLYTKIYREMRYGGLFLNIDIVMPSSQRTEEYQFKMWVDWINENLKRSGFNDDIGKYDNIAEGYKEKEENKPTNLISQMNMLNDIGYRDVECFYKYGIFAMFGGTKN